MTLDRRSLLKGIAAAGTLSVIPATADARERKKARSDAVGLLYDSTLCIGCKACVVACKEANGLSPDTDGFGDGLYDAPEGLNEYTKTVIQLCKDGEDYSFVKKQCMHCIDPACVNGCMIGALQKGEFGIVTWDADRCVGCRYCQVACPFNVPQFEWSKTAPKIVKCELCNHRLKEGKLPACSEVCPKNAVIYGKRDELLEEARRRLREYPDRYVQKIYGETDLGGTQCLYLSDVPFEDLGFRFQHDEPVPEVQQTVQHTVYQAFVAPVALYAALVMVMFRNRGQAETQGRDGIDEERGGADE